MRRPTSHHDAHSDRMKHLGMKHLGMKHLDMKHLASKQGGAITGATFATLGLVAAIVLTASPARAQPAASNPYDVTDARPYDDKLMRLSEVLGAIHYLRELCGANEGQSWRDRMRELIETDKGSALRRVKLTKSFNQGYRSYRRTYGTCSASAQATLTKFVAEGMELSDLLLRETQ